jgi:hypothetical protein
MSKVQPVNNFTPNYAIVENDLSPHVEEINAYIQELIQSGVSEVDAVEQAFYGADRDGNWIESHPIADTSFEASNRVYNVNGFEFNIPMETAFLQPVFDYTIDGKGRTTNAFTNVVDLYSEAPDLFLEQVQLHEIRYEWRKSDGAVQFNPQSYDFEKTYNGIVDRIYRQANHPDAEKNAYSNELTDMQKIMAQNPEWMEQEFENAMHSNEMKIRSLIMEDVTTAIQGKSNRIPMSESKESQNIINAAVKRVEGNIDTQVRGRREFTCLDFVQCSLQDAGYKDFVAWDHKWMRHTSNNVEAERFYKDNPNWSVYYDYNQIQPGDHVVIGDPTPAGEDAEEITKHSVIVVDKTTQGYFVAHETGDDSVPEIKFVFPEYFENNGVSSINRLDIKNREEFVAVPSPDFHYADPVSHENMVKTDLGKVEFEASMQSNIGDWIYQTLWGDED